MRKLTSILALERYGIPLRTLRMWCEQGLVYAVKVKGEWHVDLVDMLRRNDMDLLADEIENQGSN